MKRGRVTYNDESDEEESRPLQKKRMGNDIHDDDVDETLIDEYRSFEKRKELEERDDDKESSDEMSDDSDTTSKKIVLSSSKKRLTRSSRTRSTPSASGKRRVLKKKAIGSPTKRIEPVMMMDEEEEPKKETSSIEHLYVPSIRDVKYLTLKREQMIKYMNEPYFEKVIKGCFVRVLLGNNSKTHEPVYRLCRIVGIRRTSHVYKIEAYNNKELLSNKFIRTSIGGDEKNQRINHISSKNVTESEYRFWRRNVRESKKERFPTKQELREKIKQLKEMPYSYKPTEDELKQRELDIKATRNLWGMTVNQLRKLKNDTLIEYEKVMHSDNIEKRDELASEMRKIQDVMNTRESEVRKSVEDSKGVHTGIVSKINQRANRQNLNKKSSFGSSTQNSVFSRLTGASTTVRNSPLSPLEDDEEEVLPSNGRAQDEHDFDLDITEDL